MSVAVSLVVAVASCEGFLQGSITVAISLVLPLSLYYKTGENVCQWTSRHYVRGPCYEDI